MTDNLGAPSGYADLLLHPAVPWPSGGLQPDDISLLDPFAASCGVDRETLAHALGFVAAVRADTAAAMRGRLACLTGGASLRLRVAAARGDWLVLEQEIAQVCVDLLWTALLMPESPAMSDLHGERALAALLERDGLPPVCEPLLQAVDLCSLCNCTLEIVERALLRIREAAPSVSAESEGWFKWECDTRHEPVPRADVRSYEPVAERIAESLAAMPVFVGLLVVGSYAESDKHDGFNDLDLYCYCTSLPTEQMRNDFFARLGLDQQGCNIAFEYLKLDGVNVHLSLPLAGNQQPALDRLWHDGDESNCWQFMDPAFAASAYRLARGRILRDPTGVLACWQDQVTQYPPALRARVRDIWRPAWGRYAARAELALRTNDRVHALIALRYCREAYLRVVLADSGVLCDPNGLKWLLHEAPCLPAPQRDALARAIEQVHFGGIPSLSDQFCQLNALWNALER